MQALDLPIVRAIAVPLGLRELAPAPRMTSAGTFTVPDLTSSTTTNLAEFTLTNDQVLSLTGQRAASEPADGRIGTLLGYSTIFDNWYEVNDWLEGNFLERVGPHAADETIAADGPDVKILFNHGHDSAIGQKALAVHEELRADKTGVYYQGGLFDTSYNRDLLPGLRAGAYGSSFMFRVRGDAWDMEPDVSEHNPKGLPERTITNFRLYEHGPVTFPANPAATSGARCVSTTDDYYRSTMTPDAYEALVQEIRSTRDATPGDAKGASGRSETATNTHARSRALKLSGVIK